MTRARGWTGGLLGLLLAGLALAAPRPYGAAGGSATFEHRVRFVNVRGTVAGVTAQVQLDPQDLAATRGSVTVPLSELKTGIALRDRHAQGEVALDTARYPNATFVLESLTGGRLLEGQTLSTTATGRLTVKATTRSLSVPVKATLRGGRVEISTQFKFNPYDFDVRYPGSSDSVTVGVTFTLVASP
ncbi:YceI family protein [Deinococcus murrayi]|uniref:YceI family protein n=1 Tax=Deinococcus murrayi TaxID=68910 RepID=UPI00048261D7|nr:YceI family protein [Deinococcus murrayi]